jgi:hypothetical protein
MTDIFTPVKTGVFFMYKKIDAAKNSLRGGHHVKRNIQGYAYGVFIAGSAFYINEINGQAADFTDEHV